MSMKNVLKALWFTPGPRGQWGLPAMFEGKPGTAKTSTAEQEAAACGLHIETLIGSTRMPEDIGGLPVIQKDGTVKRAPDAWVQRVCKAERAVVFFDEFNHMPPSTQGATLRVINERVVGDTALPSTVRMMAARNAVEDGGGFDMSAAMANRFGHFAWEGYSVDEWADWLLGGDTDRGEPLLAATEEARVMAAWASPYAMARGLAAGFLRRRPALYHVQPEASDPKAGKAFPSPRSWEMATRALAGAQVHGLNGMDADNMVSAFIGVEAAAEWAKWRALADLPDPAELLDGNVTWKHNPARLDTTEAVLSACAAFVAPATQIRRLERTAALWKILGEVSQTALDVVVPAARVLVEARLSLNIPEAKPVLVKLNPVIAAAGMTGRR